VQKRSPQVWCSQTDQSHCPFAHRTELQEENTMKVPHGVKLFACSPHSTRRTRKTSISAAAAAASRQAEIKK
jgi:hypothetical protein